MTCASTHELQQLGNPTDFTHTVALDRAVSGPDVIKTFFMLNSAEHEICPAYKSLITNNCQFFFAKCS